MRFKLGNLRGKPCGQVICYTASIPKSGRLVLRSGEIINAYFDHEVYLHLQNE